MNAHVQLDHFKISLDQYHRMIAAGILAEDDHLELIEGALIVMVPPNPPHAYYVDRLTKALSRIEGFNVRVQNPITLSDDSEPQPDLALVTEKPYFDHHPLPEDIHLIIEVSDTTLAKDKQIKLPLFARHRIPEVWILDVTGRAFECYWEPQEGHYTKSRRTAQGRLVSSTQPAVKIDLDALWQAS
jgi:Uma2 family endonuclease